MPCNQRRGGSREKMWIEKPNANKTSSSSTAMEGVFSEAITNGLNALRIAENSGESSVSSPVLQFGSVRLANHVPVQGQKAFWKPKSYGTISGGTAVEVEIESDTAVEVEIESGHQMAGEIQGNGARTTSSEVNNAVLSKLFRGSITEKRNLGTSVFAAVSLPVAEVHELLHTLGVKDAKVEAFLKDKNMKSSLRKAHVTLAHKRSHGVAAVANFGSFLHQKVPVDITALLFSKKLAALEAQPGSVDGEMIVSKNQWPHITLWTAKGVRAKEANTLPQLLSEGKATRIEINPPITIIGTLEFY